MTHDEEIQAMLFGCTCKPYEYIELSEIGFDYAEFPCRVICEMSDNDFENFLSRLNKATLPILGMNIYCPPEIVIAGPGFDIDASAKYAYKAAKRGKALGVKVVGIGSPFSRNLPDEFDRKLARTQLLEFLKVTSSEFRKVDIKITLEALAPCFCNFINTLDEAYDIVSRLDDVNIDLVADFYNMEHSGEADIDLGKYIDKISHMHISEDDGVPTKRSYLEPKNYKIHADRINRLKQSQYNNTLTIEIDVPFDSERAQDNLKFLRSLG